jgi:hypothetical protein
MALSKMDFIMDQQATTENRNTWLLLTKVFLRKLKLMGRFRRSYKVTDGQAWPRYNVILYTL